MILLLNGAFGVGKTTVARALKHRLPSAITLDPEHFGVLLQKLRLAGEDFQDSPAWRRLTVRFGAFAATLADTMIVPMAISNTDYLDELRAGLSVIRPVRHICLTAPLATVRSRLAARGEPENDPRWSWVHRRAAECCEAHASPAFATQLSTEGLGPAEVAERIVRLLGERS